MWIDLQRYATGGQGFALYQLRDAGIDGRGTGWFHRGDFDEWNTEALVYRVQGEQLTLSFAHEGRTYRTRVTFDQGAEPPRLALTHDPRDFDHAHTYVDAGPSFGRQAAPSAFVAAMTLALEL